MTLKDAIKRIESLEQKVKELEMRPPVSHQHFHYQQPNYQNPQIGVPFPGWQITCGTGGYATQVLDCPPQN